MFDYQSSLGELPLTGRREREDEVYERRRKKEEQAEGRFEVWLRIRNG